MVVYYRGSDIINLIKIPKTDLIVVEGGEWSYKHEILLRTGMNVQFVDVEDHPINERIFTEKLSLFLQINNLYHDRDNDKFFKTKNELNELGKLFIMSDFSLEECCLYLRLDPHISFPILYILRSNIVLPILTKNIDETNGEYDVRLFKYYARLRVDFNKATDLEIILEMIKRGMMVIDESELDKLRIWYQKIDNDMFKETINESIDIIRSCFPKMTLVEGRTYSDENGIKYQYCPIGNISMFSITNPETIYPLRKKGLKITIAV